MPLVTSPKTEALAYALASLRGLTPDEAVASALRAELEREAPTQAPSAPQELSVEAIMARINGLGPWHGPTGAELTSELYDSEGLPR